jgi:hypothetical protein
VCVCACVCTYICINVYEYACTHTPHTHAHSQFYECSEWVECERCGEPVNTLWDRCVCVCARARAHERASSEQALGQAEILKRILSIVECYRKWTRAVTFRIFGRCPSCRCPRGGGGGELVLGDEFAQPRTHTAGARPSEIVVG